MPLLRKRQLDHFFCGLREGQRRSYLLGNSGLKFYIPRSKLELLLCFSRCITNTDISLFDNILLWFLDFFFFLSPPGFL